MDSGGRSYGGCGSSREQRRCRRREPPSRSWVTTACRRPGRRPRRRRSVRSSLVRLLAGQGQELGPRAPGSSRSGPSSVEVTVRAPVGAGAAQAHAGVLGLDHDADAARGEPVLRGGRRSAWSAAPGSAPGGRRSPRAGPAWTGRGSGRRAGSRRGRRRRTGSMWCSHSDRTGMSRTSTSSSYPRCWGSGQVEVGGRRAARRRRATIRRGRLRHVLARRTGRPSAASRSAAARSAAARSTGAGARGAILGRHGCRTGRTRVRCGPPWYGVMSALRSKSG